MAESSRDDDVRIPSEIGPEAGSLEAVQIELRYLDNLAREEALMPEQAATLEPAHGSMLDRLDALEQRVSALEEKDMQDHIDRTEGVSY